MSIGQGVSRGSTPKSAISYTYSNDPYNSSALPCRLWSLAWHGTCVWHGRQCTANPGPFSSFHHLKNEIVLDAFNAIQNDTGFLIKYRVYILSSRMDSPSFRGSANADRNSVKISFSSTEGTPYAEPKFRKILPLIQEQCKQFYRVFLVNRRRL